MSVLLAGAIDVSVVLALGLGATTLLRHRSAAWRHWILACAIAGAAAMPVLEMVVPAWPLPLPAWSSSAVTSRMTWSSRQTPSPADTSGTTRNAVAGAVTTPLATSGVAVLTVWLAGMVFGLGILLAGLLRLAWLGRDAQVVGAGRWSHMAAEAARWHGLRRPVLLLQGTHPALVATWGVRRPRVILPAGAHTWSEERMRAVLLHELAHVRRSDWALLIAASLLRCIYWFNPLAWIAERRLRQVSEHACDDAVLAAGVSGPDYATHLLALARDTVRRSHRWTPAAAMAHPSTLEGRIHAMLNTTLDRQPLTARGRVLSTVAIIVTAGSIAGAAVSIRASEESATPVAANTPITREAPAVRATAAAAAQSGSGVITGTLYDQLGGLLPGADIALTHDATGGNYAASTDVTGSFEFRALPTGQYTLTTRLAGFSAVRTVIDVAEEDVISRSLTLPIGSLEETITVTGERGTAAVGAPERPRVPRARLGSAPPSARTAAVFTGGIGGQIKVPRQVRKVNPIYPASAQAAGVTGHVVLVGRIGIDGYFVDLREANEGDAPAELVEAATDAVRQWAYSPTLLNGVPVEVNVTMNISFSLQ